MFLGFVLVVFFPLSFFPGDIILSKTLSKINSSPVLKFGDSSDQLCRIVGWELQGKTQQGMCPRVSPCASLITVPEYLAGQELFSTPCTFRHIPRTSEELSIRFSPPENICKEVCVDSKHRVCCWFLGTSCCSWRCSSNTAAAKEQPPPAEAFSPVQSWLVRGRVWPCPFSIPSSARSISAP